MNNLKMFICDNCGYQGLRNNDNKICRQCGKEGRLVKVIIKNSEDKNGQKN